MTGSATCPICSEQIESPAAFALHVAACTTLPADAPTATAATSATAAAPGPVTAAALATAALATPTASCPTCHMVYTSELAPHEILFHEEECDRVNEWTGPVAPMRLDANGELRGDGGGSAGASGANATGSAGSGRPMSGGKRSRDTAAATASAAAASASGPKVTLFPAHCAVCDAGGRTLLHCAGTCARSFHPMCIEEINVTRDFAANGTAAMAGASASSAGSATSASGGGSAAAGGGSVSFASAITRDKKAQKAWVCGECTRGLHTCQLCGFLGHEGHEIVRCSLPDCGLFFHPACLRAQNHRAQSPLICPRHTCTACLVIETDMTRCSSCTKCCKSIHIRCRDATGNTTTSQTRGRGDVLDPNFHVCEAHVPATSGASAPVTPERKAAQYVGLKMQSRPGDLVLILEYGNLLLPSTAKEVAPEAYNQWGVVQRVENLGDGISSAWWTQLLTVTLFSDNSSISVPNRYVLPVGSMRQYSSPTLMVRDAIKWHAMSEIHIRHLEKLRSGTTSPMAASTPPAGLLASIVLAFEERTSLLGVSTRDCLASAGDGFAAWQRLSTASSSTYLTTSAPVYIALDTRGSTKPDMEEGAVAETAARLTREPHEAAGGDDDVDMEDTSNLSGQGPSNSTSGSALSSAGGKSRSASTEPEHSHVAATVIEVVARLLEGVEALHSRGRLLGGSSNTPTTVAKDSLKDMVANMADDDDDDEDMVAIVDLPSLRDAASDDNGQYTENRLSMDDILNPLSQESLTWSQPASQSSPRQDASPTSCYSPPKTPSKKEIIEPAVEVTIKSQKRVLEPTDYDSVDVSDVMGKMGGDVQEFPEHVTKKMKIDYDAKPAIAVNFSHLPLNLKKPRNSVFGRAPLPLRPTLLRKEKVAAEYPTVVLRDLRRKVDAFFDAEDMHDQRRSKGASSVRPAFYRPTPFLYRSVRVGRRVDSISRVLLCQDKRNLKCFVQASTSSRPSASKVSKGMRTCPYDANYNGRLSYISVDLLGISGFPALEKQVRSRVFSAVATKERSMGWLWQSSNDTSVAVEDDVREPEIRLSYCAYDGSELALPAHKALRQQQQEWLCFCANVVHLTATVIQHC